MIKISQGEIYVLLVRIDLKVAEVRLVFFTGLRIFMSFGVLDKNEGFGRLVYLTT